MDDEWDGCWMMNNNDDKNTRRMIPKKGIQTIPLVLGSWQIYFYGER